MRTLCITTLALIGFGCGGGKDKTADAASADTPIDLPALALDCPTYCNQIMANCTAANAQYVDMAHCLGSCAALVVGTSKVTDTSGDTLGCRIYHSGAPSMTTPATHCVHAGPGGDLLNAATPAGCSGGDICADFCALQIKTCGSIDAPIMVAGTAITPQYQNMAGCMTACAGFDKTHLYATTSTGNSLACKLNHWTNAASQAAATPPNPTGVQTHCNHSGPTPTAPCAGAASP